MVSRALWRRLVDWKELRSQIISLNILGIYTMPGGKTFPAISVDTPTFPPAGASVTGLEVVLIPGTRISTEQKLRSLLWVYEGQCLIRQYDPAKDTLGAIGAIVPLLDKPRISPRVFPSVGFAEIESVTITFNYYSGTKQ